MKKKYVAMGMVFGMALLGSAASVSARGRETEEAPAFERSENQVIWNEDGRIVGVDVTDRQPDVMYDQYTLEQLVKSEQFKEYEQLGLSYDKDSGILFFAGMEVIDLRDEYERGTALAYLSDSVRNWDQGREQIFVTAVRDEEGNLLYFEYERSVDWTEEDWGEESWGEEDLDGEDLSYEEAAEEDLMQETAVTEE